MMQGSASAEVGVVAELWRYPVKSMGGERVPAIAVDARGLHADRLWAVRDLELGATTTARRLPMLLTCTARFAETPAAGAGPGQATEVIVTFPNGDERSSGDPSIHAALTELVGRPVELRPLPPLTDKAAYRGPLANQADLRRQLAVPDGEPIPLDTFPLRKLAELARYATPVGSFADAYPLHVLTTASLAAMAAEAPGVDFDVRRFRPGVLIRTPAAADGLQELGWLGGVLRSGEVAIAPQIPTVRCSMPVRRQPGLEPEPSVLRTISAHADRCLGVYADVSAGGHLEEGATVTLEFPDSATVLGGVVRAGTSARRRMVRAGSALMPRGARSARGDQQTEVDRAS